MTFNEWWRQYLKAGGSNHFNIMADEESARAAWEAATLAEREACAKICEGISGNEPSGHGGRYGALDCAEAIRKNE